MRHELKESTVFSDYGKEIILVSDACPVIPTITLSVNHKTRHAPSFSFHFMHTDFKLKLQELLVCIKLKTYPGLT